MDQPIIPGLPDDLALRCLAMLSHGYHGVMEAVSKRWRDVVRGEEYANYKARQGWCGDWLFVLTDRRWDDEWVAYDPDADRWHPLPLTPTPKLLFHGMKTCVLGCHCVRNKFLVILGMYCGVEHRQRNSSAWTLSFKSNEMYQFDPFKKEWSRVTSMRTSRERFASCTMDGKIYVAGGDSSEYPFPKGMNLAEVYDPLTDKWEDLPSMPVPMTSCRGIAYKGKFQVIHEYGDDQVQVFDSLSGSWHVKHENWSSSLDQVAVADDQVYLLNLWGRSLGRRDAEKDEWHTVGEVPLPPLFDPEDLLMSHYGLASLGHELYVMEAKGFTGIEGSEAEGTVDLGRVRVCDPRSLPLIWRETRPMCPNASCCINGCWASLRQQ